jgi:CDP-diacylglycerol--glycerol-3-phosphate 3-phosphatidyltransferase
MLCSEQNLFGEAIANEAKKQLHAPVVGIAMLLLTIYTVYTGITYLVENWQTLRAVYLDARSSVNA